LIRLLEDPLLDGVQVVAQRLERRKRRVDDQVENGVREVAAPFLSHPGPGLLEALANGGEQVRTVGLEGENEVLTEKKRDLDLLETFRTIGEVLDDAEQRVVEFLGLGALTEGEHVLESQGMELENPADVLDERDVRQPDDVDQWMRPSPLRWSSSPGLAISRTAISEGV
jgi:hypothetical protein